MRCTFLILVLASCQAICLLHTIASEFETIHHDEKLLSIMKKIHEANHDAADLLPDALDIELKRKGMKQRRRSRARRSPMKHVDWPKARSIHRHQDDSSSKSLAADDEKAIRPRNRRLRLFAQSRGGSRSPHQTYINGGIEDEVKTPGPIEPRHITMSSIVDISNHRRLGKGRYGSIFVCDVLEADNLSIIQAALKMPQVGSKVQRMVAQNEITVLTAAQGSPHLLQLIALVGTPTVGAANTNYELSVVVELAEHGSLDRIMRLWQKEGRVLSIQAKLSLVGDMFRGLNELHQKGFIHCDIAPGNLLVFASGTWKLADFGLSIPKDVLVTKRGSAPYVAPEVDNMTGPNSTASDVYCAAMVGREIIHLSVDADNKADIISNNLDELLRKCLNEADVPRPKTLSISLKSVPTLAPHP